MIWSLLQVGFSKKQPQKSEISFQEIYWELLSSPLLEWEGKESRWGRRKNICVFKMKKKNMIFFLVVEFPFYIMQFKININFYISFD